MLRGNTNYTEELRRRMESKCSCGRPGTPLHFCPLAVFRGELGKCACCGDCEEECRKDAEVLEDE